MSLASLHVLQYFQNYQHPIALPSLHDFFVRIDYKYRIFNPNLDGVGFPLITRYKLEL